MGDGLWWGYGVMWGLGWHGLLELDLKIYIIKK